MADPTALSHWFPLVKAAGLPVPQTVTVEMPENVRDVIMATLWGEVVDRAIVEPFVAELANRAAPLGSPFFLRTDHTSGKHSWERACFVSDLSALGSHLFSIAEYSEMAGFIGLPWSVWHAREMLPTMPVAVCPNFGNMPVCKEFRFFVSDGEIECAHPYWPRHALEQGRCEISETDFAALCQMGDDENELRDLASAAGRAVGGRWSVDLLATERGWFLTDMAEAHKSYHWEGCPPQGIEASGGDGTAPSRSDESPVGVADAPNTPPTPSIKGGDRG